MPSVVFWPGVLGGTAWYRCYTPGSALARRGWDVAYVDDENSVLNADVVVLQRVVEPWAPELVRRLQAASPRTVVVFDIDDWYDGIPSYNPASATITAEHRATVRELMSLVDVVTTSTPELADAYRSAARRVAVLPNYLDPDLWSDAEKYRPLRLNPGEIRVGWMGAFSMRGGDLELLKPWVAAFLDSHPNVRFVAAGCPELLDWLGVPGLASPPQYEGAKSHVRPYEHLPAMLAWIDIGLVPLTFNRFNQAKSWCKGLEYGAAGAPVVASPAREYREYVRPGVNGLLARHNNWGRQVDTILDDLDAYREGARKVADEYWIDDHIDKWVAAYAATRA